MAPRLTKRLLLAIEEALSSRMAGEIDISGEDDAPATEDYEDAYQWVLAQLDKRDRAQ